jgi:hypothetical protein
LGCAFLILLSGLLSTTLSGGNGKMIDNDLLNRAMHYFYHGYKPSIETEELQERMRGVLEIAHDYFSEKEELSKIKKQIEELTRWKESMEK